MKCQACDHDNLEGAHFCAQCGAVQQPAESGPDPFIGKLVGGRFRITRQLGEGGMGIVYEGEQQMGSVVRKVAVKTLHKHLSVDPSVAARFHRECGTIAQLEHPNTIKVYDFGTTDDGTLYIAMEFLNGSPLDELVAQGPIAPERVLRIIRQTAGSLEEAHRKGVIHRDLKPENIVLIERAGEKDVVKLLDFGIAARTESADAEREQKLTQQGMVLGTPPYMSPEQFTGAALDRRSDVYSLAVVAYEMLTGELPFEANTAWQWATQHMTKQPRAFNEIAVHAAPEAMRTAIMKALSKEPKDRQETAAQFADELAGAGAPATTPSATSGSTGTERMEAVPAFAATAEPSSVVATAASAGVARTVSQPVVTPAPGAAPSSKSGNGLIIGLGALGVMLAGGLALATLGGESEPTSEPLELPTAAAPEPPPATAEATDPSTPEPPEIETSEPAPTPAAPANPSRPATKTTAAATATSSPPKVSTTSNPPETKPTATATATSKPPETAPEKPPEKKPSSSAACDACLSAAKAGNIPAARSHYASCSDADKKSKCSGIAKRKAAVTAKAAVQSGNCAQAATIGAAAAAMGAASPALTREVAKCKP